MNFIQRLFGKSDESTEVLCPHCERAMEPGHKCAGMSRRYFFGLGAAAAVAAPLAAAVMASPEPLIEVPKQAVIVPQLVEEPRGSGGTFAIYCTYSTYLRKPAWPTGEWQDSDGTKTVWPGSKGGRRR